MLITAICNEQPHVIWTMEEGVGVWGEWRVLVEGIILPDITR